MENLIPLPRIESRVPNKNSIEWVISDEATFVYMIIRDLGHTTTIAIKKDSSGTNEEWITKVIHEDDAMTSIAKGVDFLEQYGYTLDTSSLSFMDKINLGLDCRNDFKSENMLDDI